MASWSDDATFYFLALVQQFPTLWDSSRDDFMSCPKKELLWINICKQMSSEYPAYGPYSVEGLKTVFANKRRTYRKEKNKVDEKKSGQARGDSYNVKWKFVRCLKFLDAVPRPGHRYATEAFSEEAEMPEEYLLATSSPAACQMPDERDAENDMEPLQLEPGSSGTDAAIPQHSGHRAPTPPAKQSRHGRGNAASNAIFSRRQTALETLANALQKPPVPDATTHFANYAGALMKQMSTTRQVKCQREILEVIERHLNAGE